MTRSNSRTTRLLVAAFCIIAVAPLTWAEGPSETAQIQSPSGDSLDPNETLILFYSDACPHCHNQLRWMERVKEQFPEIPFETFEIQVTNDAENQAYFSAVMEAYDSNTRGWPRTVIGDRVYIGFDPDEGPLRYNEQYQAWIGHRNQLFDALVAIQDAR
jgi:glutaredoxin